MDVSNDINSLVHINGVFNCINEIVNNSAEVQDRIRFIMNNAIKMGIKYVDVDSGIGYATNEKGAKPIEPVKNDADEIEVIDENGIDYKYIRVNEISREKLTEILNDEIHEPVGQVEKLEKAVEAVFSYFKDPSRYSEISEDNKEYFLYYVRAFSDFEKARIIKEENQKVKKFGTLNDEKDGYTSSYLLLIIAGALFISWGSLLVVNLIK